jgi:hypothetical protein
MHFHESHISAMSLLPHALKKPCEFQNCTAICTSYKFSHNVSSMMLDLLASSKETT